MSIDIKGSTINMDPHELQVVVGTTSGPDGKFLKCSFKTRESKTTFYYTDAYRAKAGGDYSTSVEYVCKIALNDGETVSSFMGALDRFAIANGIQRGFDRQYKDIQDLIQVALQYDKAAIK